MAGHAALLSYGLDVQERRSDYDVTNTVRVTSPHAVRVAVGRIFADVYPNRSFDPFWVAFHDFERLYTGHDPEYHGVDTTYHDIQHTLDMTLALARLIAGYEATVESCDRLGPERAMLALIAALFHDSGYLRHRVRDRDHLHGAEFTLSHVTRSGQFLERYLPSAGLKAFVPFVSRIVHFTGYEMNLDDIELDDPRDSTVGHLLGTADLVAQLADRCYLEKCRDRLYPEFVVGGIAIEDLPAGADVRYGSGRDLLAKTLAFYHNSAKVRLEVSFNRAYRYFEAYFDGENPYVLFIRKNLLFLSSVIRTGQWTKLRRQPPAVLGDPTGEARLLELALKRIGELAAARKLLVREAELAQKLFPHLPT
jgi:hypothetical protein